MGRHLPVCPVHAAQIREGTIYFETAQESKLGLRRSLLANFQTAVQWDMANDPLVHLSYPFLLSWRKKITQLKEKKIDVNEIENMNQTAGNL